MSKKITIVAVGSRGDIQPYCALALELLKKKYKVQIATTKSFQLFIESLGIDFLPIAGDYRELLATEEGLALLEGDHKSKFISDTIRFNQMIDAWKACQGSDIILFMVLTTWVYSIVEKLEVPGILFSHIPIAPTKAFPILQFDRKTKNSLLKIVNLASYQLAEFLFWYSRRSLINQFRVEQLNLPPLPYLGARYRKDKSDYLNVLPIVHHYSNVVVPRPKDWPAHIYQTGYFFLDLADKYQPPEKLKQFLKAGIKPICIGFGSMMVQEEERTRLRQVIIEAIRLTKQRAIVVKGWGALDIQGLNKDIFFIDEVPYDWLFPQIAAVVHQGAAGVSATALCAGIPSIVVPFFADQPTWGKRLQQLGVAPQPIPRKQLTAEALAKSIEKVIKNKVMQEQAAQLGATIGLEDGVTRAVEIIERYLL